MSIKSAIAGDKRSLLLAYPLNKEKREIYRTLVELVVVREGQVKSVTLKVSRRNRPSHCLDIVAV